MDFQDYYKTLSVAPDADSKTIKTAYRKLARKYHPDVSEHHEAEEKFKQISEAYEVLKDPQKRAQYDELREYGAQPQGSSGGQQYSQQAHNQGDFSDFFSSIFGGGHQSGPGAQGFSQQDFSQQGFSDQGFSNKGFSNKGFGGKGQDIETDMPIFLEDTLALTGHVHAHYMGFTIGQSLVDLVLL
jgi:curved DNA-binding protein